MERCSLQQQESFRPYGLGIYDLGGNVWEWCEDEYEPGSATRVSRGGSWDLSYRGSTRSRPLATTRPILETVSLDSAWWSRLVLAR